MNCTRLSQGDAVWADIGAYATPRPAAGQSGGGGGGGSAKELGAYGEYAIALETQLGTYGLYQNTPPLASSEYLLVELLCGWKDAGYLLSRQAWVRNSKMMN